MVASCKAKFPDLIHYKPFSYENLNICPCTHPSIICLPRRFSVYQLVLVTIVVCSPVHDILFVRKDSS